MATAEERRKKGEKAVGEYRKVNHDPKAAIHLYNETAVEYDEIVDSVDYHAPSKLAKAVEALQLGSKDIHILDVGAGTGLAAVELAKLGYKNIDAVDASDGLLEVAKKKGVYEKVMCHYVGQKKMPIDDDCYDLAVSCGALPTVHVPKEGMRDMIRVVKPDGFIAFVIRLEHTQAPWYTDDQKPYMDQLETDGLWKLVKRELFPSFMMGKEGIVIVYKVL